MAELFVFSLVLSVTTWIVGYVTGTRRNAPPF